MLSAVFFGICFFASIIGVICGVGGGVIIKPALDAFHVMDVGTISFLSGCTVLSMAGYSVAKSRLRGESGIDRKIGLPLAMGAAFGGLAGKWLFSCLLALSEDKNKIGAVQASCLLAVTAGALLYTVFKEKIVSKRVENRTACVWIGFFLGVLSSFLGIGGGPINLVILYFFFSMSTKTAAENSLYIIFFSQTASLLSYIVTKSVPDFDIHILIIMMIGGILGGVCGKILNKKISDKTVSRLFIAFMGVIICINIYNIMIYLG